MPEGPTRKVVQYGNQTAQSFQEVILLKTWSGFIHGQEFRALIIFCSAYENANHLL